MHACCRAVDDELDPQLHTHAVIANMTRDPEGRWRSVDPIALHRNARPIGAYYRDRLARNLIERGYSIAPSGSPLLPPPRLVNS